MRFEFPFLAGFMLVLSACSSHHGWFSRNVPQADPLGGPVWPYAEPVARDHWGSSAARDYYLEHPVERTAQVAQCLEKSQVKIDLRCFAANQADREALASELAKQQQSIGIDQAGVPSGDGSNHGSDLPIFTRSR